MRCAFIASLVLALAGCANNNDSSGSPEPQRQFSESACGKSSWVAGITELCAGHLVYRDYLYDDYGADAGLVSLDPVVANLTTRAGGFETQPAPLSPTAGDIRYPAGAENTADLVSLDLSLDGEELVVVFELNTLYEATQTLAALALDTDNNAATGGGEWPGLGISSSGWDEIHVFASGNPDNNLISGRIPRPEGRAWRVQAVLAQANGQVMNVAFRGPDEQARATAAFTDGTAQFDPDKGNYWEDRQAAALASGDISEFGAVVTVADMQEGITRPAVVGPGLHQRVYTSSYTLPAGEGVSLNGVPGRHGDSGIPCEQLFHYLGKYQPYAVYIPDAPGPYGLQLVLHGCGANFASKINQSNFQQRFGAEQNRILVSPNGRGPTGFFSDISERDALDALNDSLENYPIDQARVFASGYSMGGYGALRFGALYPELFAGVINWVGHTGNLFNAPLPGNPLPDVLVAPGEEGPSGAAGAIGNVLDFLGNLRHVPSVHLYSGADYLVPVTSALAMLTRLGEVGVPHDFYLHPVAEHLSYILLDDWRKEAAYSAGRTRVQSPARVSFRSDASLAYPEYDIRHDRAYWISEIVARDEGYADVDLTSLGCGLPQPAYVSGNNAGTEPVPWVSQGRHAGEPLPVAAENRLSGMLANVSSLRIDAGESCLFPGTAYSISSDGPATLWFSDDRVLVLDDGLNEGTL